MIKTWLNSFPNNPDFYRPWIESFRKHSGKQRKCWKSAFLHFPHCFLLYQKQIIILGTFDMWSANALNLVFSKKLLFGKDLKVPIAANKNNVCLQNTSKSH